VPTAALSDVLADALDGEHLARATGRAVIDAFGPVRPFVNVVESERSGQRFWTSAAARYVEAPPTPEPPLGPGFA